ncbi:hypothetical protein AAF712_002970 [Marasmius tenuissimus]|uniref:Uncharacterized protein n=1 Tax=Marasmius tenuissimus TaxID=585030 RepID=A0ABR3A901_9AGAR
MHSLQDITTQPDGHIELEEVQLIDEHGLRYPAILHRFEWAFGMDRVAFPFNSEENTLKVHKALAPYIKRQKLALAPSPSILEKALEMMEYNNRVELVDDRRKFEDFGTGPWEYVLFPTKGRGTLPPLFRSMPDGKTTSLLLDTSDFNNLPRFKSMVHPIFVIFLRRLHPLGSMHVERCLAGHVIDPVDKVLLEWPLWTHNRFLPVRSSSKRKRSRAISCDCSDCMEDECSSSSEDAESSNGCSESSDDSESWRDPESVKEVTKDDSRVKNWSRQTEKSSEDPESDPILEQYSMEASPPVAEILGRLDEAMGLRKERLQLILDAAKPVRSEKRSRASKRSRSS